MEDDVMNYSLLNSPDNSSSYNLHDSHTGITPELSNISIECSTNKNIIHISNKSGVPHDDDARAEYMQFVVCLMTYWKEQGVSWPEILERGETLSSSMEIKGRRCKILREILDQLKKDIDGKFEFVYVFRFREFYLLTVNY